jgi:hypothetical protein
LSTKDVEEFKKIKNIIGERKSIYLTPSAPTKLIICLEGDLPITPERQKQFRMGVGM